jgi:DEAD/DEAH box helicase
MRKKNSQLLKFFSMKFSSLSLSCVSLLLVVVCKRCTISTAFTPPRFQNLFAGAIRSHVGKMPNTYFNTHPQTLPELFPIMAPTLNRLGYSTPTPIQESSARRSTDENLLLIAPTGSGKTLAYLLPALSDAMENDGTVILVAPTRELAAQLLRDTVTILGIEDEAIAVQTVVLAVRGITPPKSLLDAAVLIGTPSELLDVLKHTKGAREFLASDTLRSIVLDEVDVLLPQAQKSFRTALDNPGNAAQTRRPKNSGEQERRRQQEEKQESSRNRKLRAAQRAGVVLTSDKRSVLAATEQLLHWIAIQRAGVTPLHILAGSATASRKTLERLNRAMRAASAAANFDYETVWGSDIVICRPDDDLDDMNEPQNSDQEMLSETDTTSQHTIRAVTVPSQVSHRYILLSKESASSPEAVLATLAMASKVMNPRTALVFLCGEFAKANVKLREPATKPIATKIPNSSRRNTQRSIPLKANASTTVKANESPLSVRKTCEILGKLGIDAQVCSDIDI